MLTITRILATCALLVVGFNANAQATRTWVSGVGDDANPCSRTAPCKTFAGAISKTAASGVISVLDPGGFGALTVTKAITIDGGGVEGSVLAAGTAGFVINAGANDQVTIRNITIFGAGTGTSGVRILNASGHVTLQNVTISGFHIGVEHTGTGQINVHNSYVHRNVQFGMYVTRGKATLDRVHFANNGVEGVRAWGGRMSITNSIASGHTQIGFSAVGAASVMALDNCLASHNGWGIGSSASATLSVNNSAITNSTNQALYRDGTGFLISFGNNRLVDNATNGTFSSTATLQ